MNKKLQVGSSLQVNSTIRALTLISQAGLILTRSSRCSPGSSSPGSSSPGSQGSTAGWVSSSGPFSFCWFHSVSNDLKNNFFFQIFLIQNPSACFCYTTQKVKHSFSPQTGWWRKVTAGVKGQRRGSTITLLQKNKTSVKLFNSLKTIKTNLKLSWESIYNIALKTS